MTHLFILVVAGLLTGTSFFGAPDGTNSESTGAPTNSGTPAASQPGAEPSRDARAARDTRVTRDPRAKNRREADPAGWDTQLVADREPGDRMIVDGRVLGKDRVSPVANATVYVFHTDAAGYYSENQGMDNTKPRICGVMRTDLQGRYRFSTVRPGRYATGGPAPHVHYKVTRPGAHDSQDFLLTFESVSEPVTTVAQTAGGGESWATRRPLVRDDHGVWRCTRDLWMR